MPVAFAIPYHRNIPMDKYIHLTFLLLFPVDLVITRYPEVFSIVPRILCAYCLAVLCHMNTPSNKSSHLSSIRSSPVIHVFHKSLQNNIRSSENPLEPLALEILLACIMDNPISLVVLLTFLVIIILSLLTQYVCEYPQSSLILINYLSG